MMSRAVRGLRDDNNRVGGLLCPVTVFIVAVQQAFCVGGGGDAWAWPRRLRVPLAELVRQPVCLAGRLALRLRYLVRCD